MSRNIWLFSDHHFGHEAILRFKDKDGNKIRPEFSTVDEMDDCMIELWNESIKPGDHVWHLGDLTMDNDKFKYKIASKLNGKLRLVVGNHDDIVFLAGLSKISKLVETRRFDEHLLIASHRVLHESNLWNIRQNKPLVNVHGHIHRNESPPGFQHINVSVENTGYKPVHLEDLAAQAAQLISQQF